MKRQAKPPPPPIAAEPLLTPLQRWLCIERPDVAASFDLRNDLGQAAFLTWWHRHGRAEYSAPEESAQWEHLTAPFSTNSSPFVKLITIQMRAIWVVRQDLQQAFDLASEGGRLGYFEWFYRVGLFEAGLDDTPYVSYAIEGLIQLAAPTESKLAINLFTAAVIERFKLKLELAPSNLADSDATFGMRLSEAAPELSFIYQMLPYGIWPVKNELNPLLEMKTSAATKSTGVTMIGYAHGAFGMGEHVRMATRALAAQSDNFAMLDVPAYNHMRQPEPDIQAWLGRPQRPRFNVFHVNADAMAGAIMSIGPSKVRKAYNIGYWAWELSKVPEVWRPSVDFIDEIWAPSNFIKDAFQSFTDKPVIHMPLAVDIDVNNWFGRSHFGLPEGTYLFFYMFDSYSHYERKNPFAALKAFRKAFEGRKDVGLVIKTQNADTSGREWNRLVSLMEDDERIFILNKTLIRDEVFSLVNVCDCFVSLHRSEGFGRGPAEAMWLGKPVITTNYSGNTDFTTEEVSLPVQYKLIPVQKGEYPFHEGQFWADPDEEDAAMQMIRAVDDPASSNHLGFKAAQLIKSKFGLQAVGEKYATRLKQLGAI